MNMFIMGMSEGGKEEKREEARVGRGGKEGEGSRGRGGGEEVLLTFLRVSSASKRRE